MIDTRQDEDDINGSTETDSLFNEYTATNNVSQDINDNYITDFVNFLMEKLSEKEQMVIRKITVSVAKKKVSTESPKN